MLKPNKKVIDSVSASELLEALNTLQKLNEPPNDLEISFSQDNGKSISSSKTVNF